MGWSSRPGGSSASPPRLRECWLEVVLSRCRARRWSRPHRRRGEGRRWGREPGRPASRRRSGPSAAPRTAPPRARPPPGAAACRHRRRGPLLHPPRPSCTAPVRSCGRRRRQAPSTPPRRPAGSRSGPRPPASPPGSRRRGEGRTRGAIAASGPAPATLPHPPSPSAVSNHRSARPLVNPLQARDLARWLPAPAPVASRRGQRPRRLLQRQRPRTQKGAGQRHLRRQVAVRRCHPHGDLRRRFLTVGV